MHDPFGGAVSSALKVMGIPISVAAAIVFGFGAYQGCQVTSSELAARSVTLQWSEDHFRLCYAPNSRPCNTGVALIHGLDLSSSVQRGLCESHGLKIAVLCKVYDWGRAITEPTPALDITDRVFVDGLWRRAIAEIRTRCGDESGSSFLFAGLSQIKTGQEDRAKVASELLERIQKSQKCNFAATPTACLQGMIALQNIAVRFVESTSAFKFRTLPLIHCAPLPEPWAPSAGTN